jgi:hypothetical protein
VEEFLDWNYTTVPDWPTWVAHRDDKRVAELLEGPLADLEVRFS